MMKWSCGLSLMVLSLAPFSVRSDESAFSTPEKPSSDKKNKAHFAGAKRIAVEEKRSSRPKKSKSPWFVSKTHPKTVKEEAVDDEASIDEQAPYFIGTNALIADNRKKLATSSSHHEDNYPKTGVDAPSGHIFFTGDFLYWRVREEGTEFVTVTPVEFDYSCGFRAGLGVHLPYTDGWDIEASYTDFRPSATRLEQGSFYPLFAFQGATLSGSSVTEATAHWDIVFQNLDFAFGRAYYLSSSWSVHPFVGMKGAWIDQSAHFSYGGGYIPAGHTFTTRFKNDFKGAGPLFGMDAKWHWGVGFSLMGKVASSLVMGFFENKQTQEQLGEQVVDYKKGHNLVSPMLQMLVALAWDHNWNREMCHFGLSLGFESQYWWSQNQTELFFGTLPSYERQGGDLSLYGITLSARIDF